MTSGLTYFPQVLPPNSVVGRISPTAGATEAITLPALAAALQPSLPAGTNYSADTGVVNALVIAGGTLPSVYADGQVYYVKVAVTNTGATTLNVNGIGAKNVYNPDATALVANTIFASRIYGFVYDSSLNSGAGGFLLQLENAGASTFTPQGTGATATTVAAELNLFLPTTPAGAALAPSVSGVGSIASAATCDIGTITNPLVAVSGTTTITSFGDTMPIGTSKVLTILSAGLTITPSANLFLSIGLFFQVSNTGTARPYLSTANDRIRVDCIGTSGGHNVYFCTVTSIDGTAYQAKNLGWEKQNYSHSPGANTHGGLTAHPLTAVDVTNCNSITLTTNGDANHIGVIPTRAIRLINPNSAGNTIANNTAPIGTGSVHSDINVAVNPTVTSGVITAGGLDTGSVTNNTDYFLWCVSDGVNWAYVWSLSVQFPNNATFPNYIYAAMVGWNHTDGSGHFLKYRKIDNKYTIILDGNNYPTVASGSNAGVFTAVTLFPGFVSPGAVSVDLYLKSVTAGTGVQVAANTTNTVYYGVQQPATATPMQMNVKLDIESAFIYYSSSDASGSLRLFGFSDVI